MIVTFAGRRFEYVGMWQKRVGRFPGYVEMRDVATGVLCHARADMVTLGN